MAETVRSNREVSKEYMKIFEREQMLLNEGIERGRELEKANTQREQARAERAEAELMKLKEQFLICEK